MDKQIKRPILQSLLFGIMLVLVISVCSAIAVISGGSENSLIISQIIAFLIMAIFFTAYMLKKDRSLKAFGFTKLDLTISKKVFYYIPLICIIFIQPVFYGVNFKLNYQKVLLFLVQMLIVGYTEEVLFRSIYKYLLKDKSRVFYIAFSSIVFGLLHIANGFVADDIVLVILQIINALLIGIMLSLIYSYSQNIYPLIFFHASYNFFASICKETSVDKDYLVVSILGIIYILYIIAILFYNKRNRKILI